MRVLRKWSSGNFSTSKKSGERRCVSRSATPVSMLEASMLTSTNERVMSGVIERDGAGVLAEAAPNLRDHHVADGKVDARVCGVDVPVVVVHGTVLSFVGAPRSPPKRPSRAVVMTKG